MAKVRLNKKQRELWDAIEIGNKVEITLCNRKGRKQEKYTSVVTEKSDAHLYVKTPLIGEAFLDLPPNMLVEVELEVYNPQSGRIRFISTVVGQEWLKESAIKIACPAKLSWTELRWHYRIKTALPAKFSLLENTASRSLDLTQPIISAIVHNVSEGGALFIVDKIISIGVGYLINAKVHLPSASVLMMRGRVVHLEFDKGKCGIGLKWVTIGLKDREKLREFIRDRLKK